MYGRVWLPGAPSVIFYEVWRFQEAQTLRALKYRVGALNKTNTRGSEDRGWELGEAGSDECIEGCCFRGIHLLYSKKF